MIFKPKTNNDRDESTHFRLIEDANISPKPDIYSPLTAMTLKFVVN